MFALCDENFDNQMRIVHPELSSGKVVVMFQRPGCPHCDIMKPHFVDAEKMSVGGAKFAIVDISQCRGAFDKANAPSSPFAVKGVPKVVSYLDGQYFSTYVHNADSSASANYRKAADIAIYADTIGIANRVQHPNA
jgi:thiol-disulfide isomerase/thioredoxin